MEFIPLMCFMLSMIKESSQNAIERFFMKTGAAGHMTQQAFSLARQKIKWQAFRMLFDCGVNAHYVNYAVNHGRHRYYVAINVNHSGTVGNSTWDHWVGASELTTLDDGIQYFKISPTSEHDWSLAGGLYPVRYTQLSGVL